MMKSLWIKAGAVLLYSVVAASASDFIVNTSTQSMTYNWMDGGAIYWYRLNDGKLEYKTGELNWQSPTNLPYEDCRFKNIAANNNRLLALTTSNELFLANIIVDWSQWVAIVLELAEDRPIIADIVLNAMGVSTPDGYRLDTEYYDTTQEWAAAYRAHIEVYHQPWAWAPIAREGVDYDQIQDIALGNWNGTVTTIYVLDAVTHDIFYIDEEPVMLEWKLVKGSDTLGLGDESRIDADHSVICATATDSVHWVRFDFHQPDKFPILNWTELPYDPPFDNPSDHPGWHHIGNPTGQTDDFRIDVRCADGTCWPIPKALGIGYIEGLEGVFGANPIDPPWAYPVRLIMKDETGTDNYFRMRLRHAKEMDSMPANVSLDGDHSFAFAVPLADDYHFGTQTYPNPKDYLSPLTEDCYIHATGSIIITNDVTVNPQPGHSFHAVTIPQVQ